MLIRADVERGAPAAAAAAVSGCCCGARSLRATQWQAGRQAGSNDTNDFIQLSPPCAASVSLLQPPHPQSKWICVQQLQPAAAAAACSAARPPHHYNARETARGFAPPNRFNKTVSTKTVSTTTVSAKPFQQNRFSKTVSTKPFQQNTIIIPGFHFHTRVCPELVWVKPTALSSL